HEYIKYSLRFLFHLTKNLTTHLSHNLYAVLPYLYKGSVQKSRSFWRFGLCVTAHSDDGTHGRNFQHRRFSK
ncbi:hypothetical protein, partial [uncultured Ruminococcus sp.]|uniref:hypothetical protein n=1 Tax=uncultured Ruminococcus sp. TaxID=165186 RepID=UPI002804C4FE